MHEKSSKKRCNPQKTGEKSICAIDDNRFSALKSVINESQRPRGAFLNHQSLIYKGGLKLNKNDLIAAVATSTELSKADATKAVDGVLEAITGSLQSGNEVRLVGFGTFSVANRAASTGRNPRTGETIQIPASKQPKFKAGKALKDAVN